MSPRSSLSITALAAALVLVLTGCVPEPPTTGPTGAPAPSTSATAEATPSAGATPTASATPSPSPTAATPTPTPTPTSSASPAPGTPDRAVLPSCPALLPLSTVRALFADSAEALPGGGSAADHMTGPLAKETAANARQSQVCTWGTPSSDGGFSVVAVEITPAARERLLSSLGSASSYTRTTIHGAKAFTHSEESEFGTIAVVYVFTGTVWVAVSGTLTIDTGAAFAAKALDAVRAANR